MQRLASHWRLVAEHASSLHLVHCGAGPPPHAKGQWLWRQPVRASKASRAGTQPRTRQVFLQSIMQPIFQRPLHLLEHVSLHDMSCRHSNASAAGFAGRPSPSPRATALPRRAVASAAHLTALSLTWPDEVDRLFSTRCSEEAQAFIGYSSSQRLRPAAQAHRSGRQVTLASIDEDLVLTKTLTPCAALPWQAGLVRLRPKLSHLTA